MSLLGGLLATTMLSPTYAQSNDESRLAELESKLSQALEMISSLQTEITALKNSETENVETLSIPEETVELVQENTERLEVVEDELLELEDKTGDRALVQSFDALSLDIGGFLHSAVTHVDGRDGSATSFNRQTFEILMRAQLGENWSAFLAQAFIRESAPIFQDDEQRTDPTFQIPGAGISPTVIAWANYKASDALNVRVGRFITPHGIINVDHFPAILLDPEQPQFLRPFGGQSMFANFMTGANIHGQTFTDNGRLKYDLYVGSFVGNPESFNYGGRVGYTFGDTGITVGANLGGGSRVRPSLIGGQSSDYILYGADLLYDKGPILWKSEIFYTNEDHLSDRLAFYTQPAYRLNDQWTAFYRFDFFDDGNDRGNQIEHAVGLNFVPTKNVRLRGIATFKNFEAVEEGLPNGPISEADVRSYQLSATFSF
ncbi:hypothetical protein [Pseudemcibacter aquimaris]|uniref:hypothetical protein n=1 Tax=Pseudemcibacter aquimaris TaxID=2857064 RepID=UPI002013A41B|nr:hypothetical protein [Pseudemcibacter aquimaris]MCC3860074.1 hypothetical protein [Pseudemcibacter aquimaris]WDU57403.1 hypothetical protein KW060_09350 [Pseudemcibacter aquimaris]